MGRQGCRRIEAPTEHGKTSLAIQLRGDGAVKAAIQQSHSKGRQALRCAGLGAAFRASKNYSPEVEAGRGGAESPLT
jgi:hypothetical protein